MPREVALTPFLGHRDYPSYSFSVVALPCNYVLIFKQLHSEPTHSNIKAIDCPQRAYSSIPNTQYTILINYTENNAELLVVNCDCRLLKKGDVPSFLMSVDPRKHL
jgi:hypothetical protein